jgi:hypothetical protein
VGTFTKEMSMFKNLSCDAMLTIFVGFFMAAMFGVIWLTHCHIASLSTEKGQSTPIVRAGK